MSAYDLCFVVPLCEQNMPRVRFSLEPVFHPKDVESWLRVYVPGRLGANAVCTGRASQVLEVQLELADPTPTATLCVWWYVSRTYRLDKHVDSCPKESKKLVLCETTIERAGTGEVLIADGSAFGLYDIERQVVAHARVSSSFRPSVSKPLAAKGAASGDQWLEVVRAVHRSHAGFVGTNVTEMSPFTFGKVSTPYGTMPSWAFPLLAKRRAQKVTDYNRTLEALFYNACYFAFLEPDKFVQAPQNHKLEVLGEMQTMAMRFLVYVRDVSLKLGEDHLVDDWTRIADAPVPAWIAYDCEDGSEEIVAQSAALKHAKGLEGALAEAQRLERRYYTCFCVVTLRLGGTKKWVYHALVVKFDRVMIQQHLDLPVDDVKEVTLPCLVLESTAYTTSNWEFRTPFCTKATFAAVDQFAEANTKICAEMVIDPCLYGHLVSFSCPDLLDEHGIGQVECLFEGKIGIPFKTIITKPGSDGIELVACKVDSEMKLQATNESQLFPETRMLTNDKPVYLKRRSYVWPPKAQFVVRGKDVEDKAVMDQVVAVARAIGSKVTLDRVSVYGGIGGINVVVE
jgi:hypothetical protein